MSASLLHPQLRDPRLALVWLAPTEPVAKSKCQHWLTAIRAIIVVALVATAATLVSIAYTPSYFFPPSAPQQLNCAPAVLNRCDVVSTQMLGLTEQSMATVTSGPVLRINSDHSFGNAKQEQRRTAKTTSNRVERNTASPTSATVGESAKHRGAVVNHKKTKHVPTLAQARTYQSQFNDMHGQ